jgi:hypothetical protein
MTYPQPTSGFAMRRVMIASIALSALLHACLLGVLVTSTVVDHRNLRPLRVTVHSSTRLLEDLQDSTAVHLSTASPESASVNASLVSGRVEEVIAQSQQQSAAKNLGDLDNMSRRLESVASEQSIDALADNFQSWMQLSSRATEPTAPATISEFDIASAQLHDIKRLETPKGGYEYLAVLIDSNGRTIETKMTESEGRETYELMQRMKANPLLEKIYRRIAMPVLDRLIGSGQQPLKDLRDK